MNSGAGDRYGAKIWFGEGFCHNAAFNGNTNSKVLMCNVNTGAYIQDVFCYISNCALNVQIGCGYMYLKWEVI